MASPSNETTPEPTPSPSTGSEKENRRDGTSTGAQKRKRSGADLEGRARNSRRRTLDPEDQGEESGDEEGQDRLANERPEDHFDPNQPIGERREITRELRDLQRDIAENQDEYIHDDGSKITYFLQQSNRAMARVRQTNEATIDAKGLLKLSDIHSRRVNQSIAGHTQQGGIDIDEFVSKCITFMLHGGGIEDDDAPELSSTQRQRRAPPPRRDRGAVGSDDEDEDANADGDAYNWPHFGRFAAIPSINRPAVPGFMLGPLSVKKKARKVIQRAAPLRIQNLVEVRPQVLNAEDMAKNEKNDLTIICKKILRRLETVQEWAQNKVEDEVRQNEDMTDEEVQIVMDRYSLRDTGGIDMLRFVVNPHSFGQTVENIFYVSFLIRDGYVELTYDSKTKLPALGRAAVEESEQGESERRGNLRHQSILSIDMPTWRDVCEAFQIKEPMIPHRQEQQAGGPGAKGWYS